MSGFDKNCITFAALFVLMGKKSTPDRRIMAIAIKPTPVLEGKNSDRFNKLIKKSKPVSKDTIEKIKSLIARFQK